MTTIVNNPAPANDSGGGSGMIIGLIILVVFAFLFIVYGLPALRQLKTPQITPQINVPNKIDVNIKQ